MQNRSLAQSHTHTRPGNSPNTPPTAAPARGKLLRPGLRTTSGRPETRAHDEGHLHLSERIFFFKWHKNWNGGHLQDIEAIRTVLEIIRVCCKSLTREDGTDGIINVHYLHNFLYFSLIVATCLPSQNVVHSSLLQVY